MATKDTLAPTTIEGAMQLAEFLSKSDLVPKDYRGKAGDILIAISLGQEVGLKWAQALQNIAVIGGRPTIWGDAGLGIVMSHPAYEWIREEDNEQTETATCILKRKGHEPVVRKFGQADAERIEVYERDPKSGETIKRKLADRFVWRQYKKRMRQMRARWWAMKDVFADALKGIEGREWVEADLNGTVTGPEREAPPDYSYLMPKPKALTPPAAQGPLVESARGQGTPVGERNLVSSVPGTEQGPAPVLVTAPVTEGVPAESGKIGAAGTPSNQLTFTLNNREMTTAGATKGQMLKIFELATALKKKAAGADLAKAILQKEFRLAHKTELDQEQADRYLVRLQETLEGRA